MRTTGRSHIRHRGAHHGGHRILLRALGAAAMLALAGTALADASGTAGELPSSVKLEQWETKPGGNWITGALQANNSDYIEGEAVPFRLVIPSGIDAGQYLFSVCRNYEDGAKRGYLYLAPFDTDRPAAPGGTISSTSGNFSAVNATIDAVNEVEARGACKAGDRETVVTITKGAGEAYVLWGGHLASPLDPGVGPGNSAAAWPGASLHMKILKPSKDVAIQTCTIGETPTPPEVTATTTAQGTATETPTEAATATATQPPATATAVRSSTPSPQPTSTGTPPATETAAATETPIPTETPVPTETPAATATGTPAATTTAATATATRTPAPGTPTATAPAATATVEAQEAATATAISEIAGAERLPRRIPSVGGCESGGGGVPWLLMIVGGIGLVAIGAGAAIFVMQRTRSV
jgi:hypothetical protein